MGWSKEELGEIISKHPLRAAAAMSFIVAGATSLVVGNSGITASNVTANGTVSIEPAGEATGFDASPLGILDGAVLPTPVVTAGAMNVLESAWDIDDKVARTIGWRLKTEGAAGDSSNAPTTKLLIQSTADNSTWTTRATIDMAGLLAVTGAITGTTGTFSGDIEAAGGYRVFSNAWMTNIPSGTTITSYPIAYGMARAGSLTAIGGRLMSAITDGSVTLSLRVDGVDVPGHTLTWTSADAVATNKVQYIAKDEHTFAAGRTVGFSLTASADLLPNAAVDVGAIVELEQ